MLVGDIIKGNATYYPNKTAFVMGDTRVSWFEANRRVNSISNAILNMGLKKGDRLAILSPNCFQYWELFFAGAKTGIIGVPLNIMLHVKELIKYLNYTTPKAIVIDASLVSMVNDFKVEVSSLKYFIGIGDNHGLDLDYESLVSINDVTDPEIKLDEDDIYMIAATSGTTGTMKGAMLSHRNALSAIRAYASDSYYVDPEDAYLCHIPMYFNPGGPATMTQFHKAARGVVIPRFSPQEFLDLVERERITHTILVPTMLSMLLQYPDLNKYDVSSIKRISMGGSPMPPALLKAGQRLFNNAIVPNFGTAETYSYGLQLRNIADIEDDSPKLKSLGKPVGNSLVRVVNDNGEDIKWGGDEAGEIIIKGDTVFQGYWELPEETKHALRDGWFYTGDVAIQDEEGYVYLVDRKKDIIITGGINVYSVEVEQVIASHPAVLQVAVIGVPHEKWGEAIKAVVVLRYGEKVTEAEIIDLCQQQLASYKKPVSVDFVTELPVSATGKVLKRELRKKY